MCTVGIAFWVDSMWFEKLYSVKAVERLERHILRYGVL
jgi:hypothetical protein